MENRGARTVIINWLPHMPRKKQLKSLIKAEDTAEKYKVARKPRPLACQIAKSPPKPPLKQLTAHTWLRIKLHPGTLTYIKHRSKTRCRCTSKPLDLVPGCTSYLPQDSVSLPHYTTGPGAGTDGSRNIEAIIDNLPCTKCTTVQGELDTPKINTTCLLREFDRLSVNKWLNNSNYYVISL